MLRQIGLLLVLIALIVVVGCAGDSGSGGTGGTGGTGNAQGTGNEKDPFADLTPEDQKLAKAQGICPVGDSKLGSMGTPIAVDVDGRKVFI